MKAIFNLSGFVMTQEIPETEPPNKYIIKEFGKAKERRETGIDHLEITFTLITTQDGVAHYNGSLYGLKQVRGL